MTTGGDSPRGYRLGRQALRPIATVVTPDTILRWHRELIEEAGIQVVRTPFQAPNANAYAERFVRSITHECLNRIIPFGESHFRRAPREFVEHYHRERNHQGLENECAA